MVVRRSPIGYEVGIHGDFFFTPVEGRVGSSDCNDGVMNKRISIARTMFVLVMASSLTLLAGCRGQPRDAVTTLDRSQVESDELPAGPEVGVVAKSTRLLFGTSDARYFVGESTAGNDVCLIIYVSSDAWVKSCEETLPIILYVEGGQEAQLNDLSEGVSSDTWEQVADNLALAK